MDDKNVTARKLSLPSRSNHRHNAATAAVVTAAALFLGGCDWGESPQMPYQPGSGGNGGGYIYDDGYSEYDDGYEGGGPGRFNPPPPKGPYSP